MRCRSVHDVRSAPFWDDTDQLRGFCQGVVHQAEEDTGSHLARLEQRLFVLQCGLPAGAGTDCGARDRDAEEVMLWVGDCPLEPDASGGVADDGAHVRNLFGVILGLQQLKAFTLQMCLASSPVVLNELLQACRRVHLESGALPSPALEIFMVTSVLVPPGMPDQFPVPLSPQPDSNAGPRWEQLQPPQVDGGGAPRPLGLQQHLSPGAHAVSRDAGGGVAPVR